MQRTAVQQFELPALLNDSFLQGVIRKARNDSTIALCHSCKIRPVAKPGQNFSSILYRTTVHYRSKRSQQEQAINLILKSESKSAVLKDPSLFETEIRMYSEVLPSMNKILEKAHESLSVPRLIYSSEKPAVIILEDLFPSGWIERGAIESFEDALPVIQTIAKFHAASFCLNLTHPNLCNIDNAILEKNIGGLRPLFSTLFNCFADSVGSWEGFAQAGAKLQALKPSFEKRIQQIYTPNRGCTGYNVLNHGDFHAKNLLHKMRPTPRSGISETTLIDFQCCHWGSPAIDVLYLLNMVVAKRLKHSQSHRIVREYHQRFEECVRAMGHRGWIPSLDDLNEELQRNGFLELMHIAVFEQFRHVDFNKASIQEILQGRAPNEGVNSEKYRSEIREDLVQLFHRRVID